MKKILLLLIGFVLLFGLASFVSAEYNLICTDSDEGENYYEIGITSTQGEIPRKIRPGHEEYGETESLNMSARDFCASPKEVAEYFCDVVGLIGIRVPYYECENECFAGKCLSEEDVKEIVTCIFNNFSYEEKCWSSNGLFSCDGGNDDRCIANVVGLEGEEILFKSTCSGDHYIIIDGEDENIVFECSERTNVSGVRELNQLCGNGCALDNKCYPFGYRKAGQYCSDSLEFMDQLSGDTTCDNHFECRSNLCVDDSCVEAGFFQKIISWFTRLFGGG